MLLLFLNFTKRFFFNLITGFEDLLQLNFNKIKFINTRKDMIEKSKSLSLVWLVI